MSRVCTVCRHAERGAIDAALVGGTPFRNVAKRHSLSVASLFRHRKEHIARALVKAAERKGERLEDGILEKVARLEADARRIGERAESEGDLRAALVANRELLDMIRLLHELTTPVVTAAAVRAQAQRMAEAHGISVEELLARAEKVAAGLAADPVPGGLQLPPKKEPADA